MKAQTFIVCLENENNITINFERFTDKQFKTVLRKYTEYMGKMKNYNWFMQDIKKAAFVRIYQTPYETSAENMVYNVPFSEFIQSLA